MHIQICAQVRASVPTTTSQTKLTPMHHCTADWPVLSAEYRLKTYIYLCRNIPVVNRLRHVL